MSSTGFSFVISAIITIFYLDIFFVLFDSFSTQPYPITVVLIWMHMSVWGWHRVYLVPPTLNAFVFVFHMCTFDAIKILSNIIVNENTAVTDCIRCFAIWFRHQPYTLCFVGVKYAMISMKLMMIAVLRRYSVHTDCKLSEIVLKVDLLTKSAGGYPITIRPRHGMRTPVL